MAILESAALPVARPTSPLELFCNQHPRALVGRPDVVAPALVVAACFVGTLVAAAAAVATIDGNHAWVVVLAAVAAILCAARLPPSLSRLSRARELMRQGACSYALDDDAVILVDGEGVAAVIELDCIEELSLSDGEPRIRVADEHQGRVYAVLFGLFDRDLPGPDPHAFFAALAARISPERVIPQ